MNTRRYIAFCDDGHDYNEVEFYSAHRANSKANLEDAKKELERKYGYTRSRQITIKYTQLNCNEF